MRIAQVSPCTKLSGTAYGGHGEGSCTFPKSVSSGAQQVHVVRSGDSQMIAIVRAPWRQGAAS